MTYRQLSPFLLFYERGNQGSERLHSCLDSLRGEATLEPSFLMASSLLIVTTPVYMEDYRTYPVGGGKCHKPAFFRPGGNLTCRLSSGKSTPIMQLHSTPGEDGYPRPVLFRPGVGVRVGITSCADRAQKNPSTLARCITLFFPVIHASYTPIILCRNPKASYGQTKSLVFLSETAALGLHAACGLRCAGWVQGETGGLVVSGSI